MHRVPDTGPKERQRQREIRRLERLLRELEGIPERRRENELADVRADICKRLLSELGAPGHPPLRGPVATVEIVDIDRLIEELGPG